MADWTIRRRYRRTLWYWTGEVYACPPFVDAFVDDVKPRLLETTYAFTERGVRRSLAKIIWRRTHPKRWSVRGHRV